MSKVYVSFNNKKQVEVTNINNIKVGELIKLYTPEYAINQDSLEDAEVYLENHENDLPKDQPLIELCHNKVTHFHISRCRKVTVTIEYGGRTIKETASPSITLKKVFGLVIEKFGIPKDESNSLRFYSDSNNSENLDFDLHIGSLSEYPTCGITIYLGKPENYLG